MADAYDSRMSLIFDAAWMGLLLVSGDPPIDASVQ